MAEKNIGRVVAIIGPVLDIEFPAGKLPAIYNAVHIQDDGKETGEPIDVIAEVAQQLGESVVRCVSMKPTYGMVRGMKAEDLGGPITVPVGRETLGRILNVSGDPVDGRGPVNSKERWPIHREPPSYDQQATSVEMFETGIKVIDLLEPYTKASARPSSSRSSSTTSRCITAAIRCSQESVSGRARETTSTSR